jgi:hypothetical protein
MCTVATQKGGCFAKSNSQAAADVAEEALLGCYSFGEEKKEPLPLILGEIGG